MLTVIQMKFNSLTIDILSLKPSAITQPTPRRSNKKLRSKVASMHLAAVATATSSSSSSSTSSSAIASVVHTSSSSSASHHLHPHIQHQNHDLQHQTHASSYTGTGSVHAILEVKDQNVPSQQLTSSNATSTTTTTTTTITTNTSQQYYNHQTDQRQHHHQQYQQQQQPLYQQYQQYEQEYPFICADLGNNRYIYQMKSKTQNDQAANSTTNTTANFAIMHAYQNNASSNNYLDYKSDQENTQARVMLI